MVGDNGLAKESPMEKLLRDAHALLIADGASHLTRPDWR